MPSLLHPIRVDYLLTAEHSKQCSIFEFSIAPGWINAGRRCRTKIEEIFYVLEGEVDLLVNLLCMTTPYPNLVFCVPPGAAGAFGNSGSSPARMLLITAPPGHEKYFDELRDLDCQGQAGPRGAREVACQYNTVQLAYFDRRLIVTLAFVSGGKSWPFA